MSGDLCAFGTCLVSVVAMRSPWLDLSLAVSLASDRATDPRSFLSGLVQLNFEESAAFRPGMLSATSPLLAPQDSSRGTLDVFKRCQHRSEHHRYGRANYKTDFDIGLNGGGGADRYLPRGGHSVFPAFNKSSGDASVRIWRRTP